MKLKRGALLSGLLLMVAMASAQTQQGYAKTKGRLESNGTVVAGQRIAGVTVKVKGGNAVVSSKKGTFTLVVPNQSFFLQNVQKEGFVLTDPDVLSKQYEQSKNPLVLVLENQGQLADDRLAAERKIRRTLQRQLQEKEEEIETLKTQQKLSDAEYRKRLQALYAQQESNERLIGDMADRYSRIDFDEVDEFNCHISQLILEGHLKEADSLLNTKGDIQKRADMLRQHQQANILAEQELEKKRKKLEKSKALAKKELNDLAQDCYSKYEIFKIQYQNDSAAHYIALRASLDTTNVEWQNEAAKIYQVYLCDFATALRYCQRALYHHIQNVGENTAGAATCYQNIGVMYSNMEQFEKALENYEKAESILKKIYGELYEGLGDLYISYGLIYEQRGDYSTALDYVKKAYDIMQQTESPQKNFVNRVYTLIGNVYSDIGDYAHAEEFLLKAVEHAEKEYEEFSQQRGIAYQNLGRIKKLQRQFAPAMELYQRALRVYQKIFGEQHDNVASIYINISSALMDNGHPEEATPYLQKGLDILLRIYGENNTQVAMTYLNVGSNYAYAKQYEKALEYYWKSYEILLPLLGAENPYMASVYMGLGSVYNEMGNYPDSKKYILKCVDLFKKTYGENYPYRKEIEEGLVEMETKMKQGK